jgi:C-terminal processing protease CtpA/Prc
MLLTTTDEYLGFVAHTEELIFDLRQNGGGQPALVTMVASSLFDRPTHLVDIYNHKEDTTAQNWILSYLPGPRLTKQPVFVLISKRTFSGAEEFAFDLKNQKRATIVGETTDRGAHPVSGHPVADYFMVGVPFAKFPDLVTKTNWEGTGMEPDVKVPATNALTPPRNWRSKIRAKKDSKQPVDSISVWPMTNAARNRKHRATIGILRRYRQATMVPTPYSVHF